MLSPIPLLINSKKSTPMSPDMLSASQIILTAQRCMLCECTIGIQQWCTFTDMPAQLWIVPGGSLSYMPIRRISTHQQKLTRRLIRRRCVLTQATSFIHPVRPVRPVLRRNHPLRHVRPDPPSNPPLHPDEISPRPGVLKTSQI